VDVSAYARYVVALLFVLALIALLAWVARRLRIGGVARPGSGERRLAVIEVAQIDPRRRLVLIRRDATEHLLLLGPDGADRVVEAGIPVGDAIATAAVRRQTAEAD